MCVCSVQTVTNVKVTVRGLYHPNASDLSAMIRHNDISARLFDQEPILGYQFGRPPTITSNPNLPVEDRLSGIGDDFTFIDMESGQNLALDGMATQSSTFLPGGEAHHAIDGNISPYFSSLSVARTSGNVLRDPTPWWQLR